MRVDVHNRAQVETLTPRENVWVISIHTPGDDPAPLREGWERVERFCFSDITGDSTEIMLWVRSLQERGRCVALFNEAMAEQIREMLRLASWKKKDIVVHCDAGVSRSQAVARFARQLFNADVVSHTVQTDMHCNGLVLRLLMRKEWESQMTEGSYTCEPEVSIEDSVYGEM